MNRFDFHRFKYFPGLGRNYSWAGLHGTLTALPVWNSTCSFCGKYRGFFKSASRMTMIIIVMMIRMLMMGAIIAGRDCMVLPPCLVLYSACVANIGRVFLMSAMMMVMVMTMIIIVMMIRMVMMGAVLIIARQDCMVPTPCLAARAGARRRVACCA